MERSRDVRFETQRVPLTWEIPFLVVCATVFFIAVTPLVMQALLAWAATGSYAWPVALSESVEGLLRGRFGQGLAPGVGERLPADGWMWTLALLCEGLVLTSLTVVGMWAREARGGTARHGLATSSQAAEALGLPRLRSTAAVIRPDLYGPSR